MGCLIWELKLFQSSGGECAAGSFISSSKCIRPCLINLPTQPKSHINLRDAERGLGGGEKNKRTGKPRVEQARGGQGRHRAEAQPQSLHHKTQARGTEYKNNPEHPSNPSLCLRPCPCPGSLSVPTTLDQILTAAQFLPWHHHHHHQLHWHCSPCNSLGIWDRCRKLWTFSPYSSTTEAAYYQTSDTFTNLN